MMKRIYTVMCVLALSLSCMAQVELKSEGLDTAYVSTILNRAEKNIQSVGLVKGTAEWTAVRNIVANRYFELNAIYEERDAAIKVAKETLQGAEKNAAIDNAKAVADSKCYRSHFAMPAQLGMFISPEKIIAVKDGITMGVVDVTYDATLDMIPTLTTEEKLQIRLWLEEAREFALDAESSKKKHDCFGKYKGRINNYLAKRGYDLVKEREQWYKRIEERKK